MTQSELDAIPVAPDITTLVFMSEGRKWRMQLPARRLYYPKELLPMTVIDNTGRKWEIGQLDGRLVRKKVA